MTASKFLQISRKREHDQCPGHVTIKSKMPVAPDETKLNTKTTAPRVFATLQIYYIAGGVPCVYLRRSQEMNGDAGRDRIFCPTIPSLLVIMCSMSAQIQRKKIRFLNSNISTMASSDRVVSATTASVQGYALPFLWQVANQAMEKKLAASYLSINERGKKVDAPQTSVQFSDLVLGRVLGRGGFCIVREIVQVRNNSQSSSRSSVKGKALLFPPAGRNSSRSNKCVLKKLQPHNTFKDAQTYIHGLVDLAMEALILSKLSHPNIITLKGTASLKLFQEKQQSDCKDPSFFLVLEKLNELLPRRLLRWKKHQTFNKLLTVPDCTGRREFNFLWVRLSVALDVARALRYLHDRKIVYRDVKPDNIGKCNNQQGAVLRW
jgi:Protein kinase domain